MLVYKTVTVNIRHESYIIFNIQHYKDVGEQAVGQWRTELWKNYRSLWDVTFPNSNDDERIGGTAQDKSTDKMDGVATCKSIKLKTVAIRTSVDIFDVTSHTE